MKSRIESRKIIVLMLLTTYLICGAQSVSHGGELFWGLGEAVGAIGEGLGAAGEGIGAGFGAVGEGLGAAGEGLGAAWEAFETVGEAFGVHPIELIATGGISALLRHIPLPEAHVRGRVRGASNVFVIPESGQIGIVVSGSVYFWDSNAEQFAAPLIHGAPIFNFVVSPDGGVLATTSEGGNVQLWTRDPANVDMPWTPSGRQLDMSVVGYTTWAQLKLEPKIHILSTAFSPDSEILAGGSAHGTVRLWNAMTGGIRTTLHGHSDTVTSVTFSPDGGMLATASADGTVRLWDPRTGDYRTTLAGHTGSVLSVAFNPVNGLLASASIDGTVRLWNPNTGGHEATLDHESPVLDIAFSPDGEVLASANINGSVRLWDPETRRVHALLGHGSPVTTVAFGADKHSVITGSKDGRIRQWEVWDATDSVPDILTASTKSPLTERSIHGNVVTLTLSRLAYARSVFDIDDAIHVIGIPGVTFDNFFDVDRVSDTEVTVELKFNGNIDTDANLTFTVEADAVPGYFGPPLTAQMPVTAFTESVTASTASPLSESTLNGSVVTLTLDGGAYARSRIDIGRALNVSGVPGVAVDRSDVDRLSDTEIRVELGFNGDIDADATLTFSVGAGAIAGYGGAALTATLPVVASMESVAASTVSSLTERTLNGSVVTLTLNGRDYAKSIFDIRDAVKVSGVDGVTMPWHQPDRKSDAEITVKLEFNGDVDTDATLTFTVGADAIAGYNGAALTVQLPVATFTESVAASPPSPLTEATLEGSLVTLRLSGCTYEQSIWDIQRAIKVSGISSATVNTSNAKRVSDTEVAVNLEFNGNIDTDATLTFTVEAKAIKGYNGSALTAQLPVTASTESVVASTASPLTESTLNGSVVTLTLSGRNFESSSWDISRALAIAGIDGLAKDSVRRISDTEVTVELEFNGDIDEDTTLTFTLGTNAIAGYGGSAFTTQLPVTASTESVAASTLTPLTEETLNGDGVTLTLSGCTYEQSIRDAVKVSGITGVEIPWRGLERKSDTEVTVTLEFDGNMNADATLVFSVDADAIAGYSGLALTTQLLVTASTESVAASTLPPLTEGTLNESTITLTLSGRIYAQSVRDGVKVSGIAGVTIPWRGIDRKSDTEITVELEYNGDIDTDSTLTFSVAADAIAGYGGPPLTAQLPVTAFTESVTASITSPLIESTLNGSVATLTLAGRAYAESIWDIRDALKLSGIAGATVDRSATRRVSDTAVAVAIEFNGDIDASANLTFSVGKDAIANYNGPALAAQLPVSASTESVVASTPSPLTEHTLNESVVTLTLSGRNYTRSSSDISRALTITGIDGVTKDSVRRISNTEATVELEFVGDFDTDATLTLTVGPGAISGYDGTAFTQQIPVAGGPESIVASTAAPLTEATLNESVVTLTLSGRNYARYASDISRALTITGINGVTKDSVRRISNTEATVELEFVGDFDTDATLTFTVGSGAIADYNGPAFTQEIPVAGGPESIVASTAAPLTEATLDGGVVTLTLSGRNYVGSRWDISRALTITGINGVTKDSVRRISNTEATVELEFVGDFDTDATLTFTVGSGAIADYNGPAFTQEIPVAGGPESIVASTAAPLTEATLDGGVVTLTLSGRNYVGSRWDISRALTIAGIDGVTKDSVRRVSDTEATVELEFDGDFDTDATLTFTLGPGAIANYSGPALTAQLPVTAMIEDALAANFPNPFNPETWIPYQLASDAEVTLTIYASDGQLVRRLGLGHQTAGTYYSHSRAAYWDGKNDFGETVASGVYFYTLAAGDFSATRRMLIRK